VPSMAWAGPLFASRRESGAPGVAVARGAAAALLRSGGPSAVTIDAVTRAAHVARATLYRHFPSGTICWQRRSTASYRRHQCR
jgi:hypothetical protein